MADRTSFDDTSPVPVARVRQVLDRMPGSHELGRALLRRGAVLDVALGHGDRIRGLVRSSSGRGHYIVSGSLSGHLVCQCSWGGGCKHVAAVLFQLIAGGGAPPLASPPPALAAVPTPEVADSYARWIRGLAGPAPLADGERLAFRLALPEAGEPLVQLASQRPEKNGGWTGLRVLTGTRGREVAEGKRGEAALLDVVQGLAWAYDGGMRLRGRAGAAALGALIDTGRLFAVEDGVALVKRGPPRRGELTWELRNRHHYAVIDVESEVRFFPTCPVHYFDPETGEVGLVETDGEPHLAMQWLSAPAIPVADADRIARRLAEVAPRAPTPVALHAEIVREAPRAVLTLSTLPEHRYRPFPLRTAELSFRYLGHDVPARLDGASVVVKDRTRVVQLERDLHAENDLRAVLVRFGFTRTNDYAVGAAEHWRLGSEADWLFLLCDRQRALAEARVDIVVDPSFDLTVIESTDWFAQLEPSGIDWFDVELGIRVEGERLSLLPLLVRALRGGDVPPQGFFVQLPDGRYLLVPRERIEPLADLLVELASLPEGQRVFRIPRLRSMDLAATLREENATFESLRALRDKLTSATLPRVKLPRTFGAKLRDYQMHGVCWLAFLNEVGLGAVLADDMGLGKTVQVLALLALLHKKDPLRGASLIVAPTSVLLSWVEQMEQFVPRLSVLVWHGPNRYAERNRLRTAAVVLTSYAILRRDHEELDKVEWDLCVLDEAQTIKNANTVFAERAKQLKARQRIALTGTPVENHLGELWSIVSFAVPGALGSDRAFRAVYRTPIEKKQDEARLDNLKRRLAPILLRRTKEQVASELPPKTIIEHPIELGDAQRDLYEAVRASLEQRVREEIANKGISRSQIILLDALLKLRQICCDPRLLKTKTSKRTTASAKLEAFRELVETLVEEGRKILVFSQFVEMLELIEPTLTGAKIPYSMLTGSTVDRAAAVANFREGPARVFLISLKAGGTGLNLIEADTVIHYDPWWNPAVEAQATDRAHRIGQLRPVFVHKLIARGTVEEKILQLQARKAQLAHGLLEGTGTTGLDEKAVAELLAPLPARRG